MPPVLHDAVTLRHFSASGSMGVLEGQHGHKPEPRWTEEIREEIASAARAGESHCSAVLTEAWLGPAATPDTKELAAIYRLQVGLNEGRQPPTAHLGEAEAIYFAEQTGGEFATDDNGAFDFARRRPTLGPGRVMDSVHILRNAVAVGEITAMQAAQIAADIEAAGRYLRPEHRVARGSAYFA